jgi:hypothetical protein
MTFPIFLILSTMVQMQARQIKPPLAIKKLTLRRRRRHMISQICKQISQCNLPKPFSSVQPHHGQPRGRRLAPVRFWPAKANRG